ncbi:unnamed protein product [Ambrosiozyma monospora]|uniref:Unnamed protein product n=1 Tax=Ambrosiozyma monospora TaxID=43982 RepID=A0ACB5U3S4_AMBMO|nr:unnamed protein product [Ambrosiozyma monospora]
MVAIGIAFGNSTSSISVTKDGKVDVIANPDGDRFIPSALSYVGDDEYHGAQALAQLVRNPKSTVVNFRDFIGLPFSKVDPTYSQHSAHPVDVNGKVGYEINGKTVTVEEIAQRHLKSIKLAAEDYIGQEVEGAVITVPTDFTDAQKETLTKVSESAGLKVLQLINEPSSALLAHLAARDELLNDKIFVVADFGGIRSDAAVIAVRGGVLTVLSTAHDYNLGGDKLDDSLADFFAKEFQKKYKADPKKTAKSLAKLKSAY